MLVKTMICAKTDKLIKMPIGMWIQVGSRNRALDADPDTPMRRGGNLGYISFHRTNIFPSFKQINSHNRTRNVRLLLLQNRVN